MAPNRQRIQQELRAFQFEALFVDELGWDRGREPAFVVTVKDGGTFVLRTLAKKRGFKVLLCDVGTAAMSPMPSRTAMSQIDRAALGYAYEHIIVYFNGREQVWQWVKREPGKPLAPRYITLQAGQSGQFLAERLQRLNMEIDEEQTLTAGQVSERARSAFDVERVTKKFYDRFQKEHGTFMGFIEGITGKGDREWYTSLMLNRLMFIYFIQKQGFLNTTRDDQLNGDTDYLRHRLTRMQDEYRGDSFYSFYRYFLLKLFHDGLSKREHAPELERLLGRVPYLNGGLFDVHVLEASYPEIQIPDEAFEKIFDFFDEFSWYLDDRELHNDREINPDVLGYIFEKYINRKQMGAYYTKEDITGYISKNTILPYIFDRTRDRNEAAFEPDGLIWPLLRDNPDRYFYAAAKKGCDLPLPDDIAAGLHNVSKRSGWNRPAEEDYALPTEMWREVVARRQRYEEIRAKIVAGEVTTINDFITYNLDINLFAREVIENCEDTQLLRTFYESIESVTVLDPTCGSGAFLFAALNILEPLYAACLTRMKAMVDEESRYAVTRFSPILARVGQHHNPEYFILKSIILNNLYGVDIMEEAVEICKLRLFLKLASQVRQYNHIEPLPDIDFNIRAGNTLIGFATYADAERVIGGDLFYNVMERIQRQAEEVERSFANFRAMQTQLTLPSEDMATMKAEIREKLKPLNDELNRYLARQYGIDRDNIPQKEQYEKEYAAWQHTHQPFHWFVEFYGIMSNGGFDVIIGNPPYVEYSKVKKTYKVFDYTTMDANNLFAFVIERSIRLSKPEGCTGLIVQLSAFSTPRMVSVTDLVSGAGMNYISFFECRPGKLFEGIDVRLAIWLRTFEPFNPEVLTTQLNRFATEMRPYLFSALSYVCVTHLIYDHVAPKLSTSLEASTFEKLLSQRINIGQLRSESAKYHLYYSYGVRYWARVLNFRPYYRSQTTDVSTGEKTLSFQNEMFRNAMVCVMTSSLLFWFYCVTSDGHNFTKTVIDAFPTGEFDENILRTLNNLCSQLISRLEETAVLRKAFYKTTGEIEYREYDVSKSKPIIDEIDRVLARHYGFTDEELDFIINYDIKYRMGRDGAGDGDGAGDEDGE